MGIGGWDLYGDGLPGILSESAGGWFYKENEGGGSFGPQEQLRYQPACSLARCVFGDLNADGNLDVAVVEGRDAGYFSFDRDEACWTQFRPFPALPHISGGRIRPQWLDLDGDGRSDLLLPEQQRLTWFANEGDGGFSSPSELTRPGGDGSSAPLSEDLSQDFFFADMTGDGQVDQVRIRNGRVEYWPQLGRGHFGDPILMEGSPWFAPEGDFDARRLVLVDLTGNGTADIVYVGIAEVRYWHNACGNSLIEGGRIRDVPVIDNLGSVQVLDYRSNGTPCLVWSSPLAGATHVVQYLPLMGSRRPRMLLAIDNSLGQRVELTYESSALHYLRDKAAGKPWRTKLPHHQTVVSEKRLLDQVAGRQLTVTYAYHDGAFDDRERSFAGFGRVDQFDALTAADSPLPEDVLTAPICVRTWFHQGRELSELPDDCYQTDPSCVPLVSVTDEGTAPMSAATWADALRALGGRVVRQETLAVEPDGTVVPVPFTVNQSTYRLRMIQPAAGEKDASFFAYSADAIQVTLEQQTGDPRVQHQLTLDVDAYGNVLRQCSVSYPRRRAAFDAQAKPIVIAKDTVFSAHDLPDELQLGVAVETQEFEITGLAVPAEGLAEWNELRSILELAIAAPLAFDQPAAGAIPQARLVSWARSYFWDETATEALPLGEFTTPALPHHLETAVFTPGFVIEVYDGRVDEALLAGEGGYRLADGYWWSRAETMYYGGVEGFYQLAATERTDGARSSFQYDADWLSLTATTDPVGNTNRFETDSQQRIPWRTIDPNENVHEIMIDPLGIAIATASYGSILDDADVPQPYGDAPLIDYRMPAEVTINEALADPTAQLQEAGTVTVYDLDCWRNEHIPARILTLTREQNVNDGSGAQPPPSEIRLELAHLDGLGNVLQSKLQVEAGQAFYRDATGRLALDAEGRPQLGPVGPRWLASGHVVLNHKQQPVRNYEPFFTTSAEYEGGATLDSFGVFEQTTYDPLGRVVRNDHPNGTFARSDYGSWQTGQFDENDTVNDSDYRLLREGLPDTQPEKRALRKAQVHAGTPTLIDCDPAGRTVRTQVTLSDGRLVGTEATLDQRGAMLAFTDERDLTTFTLRVDMLGHTAAIVSADSGPSWTLTDSHGRKVRHWTAAATANG